MQNSPPVFEGSLTGVVWEDADIGTPVMTIKAHDGDKEHPRKIVYELVESELFVGSVIMCTLSVFFACNTLSECLTGSLFLYTCPFAHFISTTVTYLYGI